MCLINIKRKGKEYEYGYKIFSIKDNKLYPFKEDYCIKNKPFKLGLNKCEGEGFHAFIKKEDAELTLKFIKMLIKTYNKMFTSNKFVIKKVQVKEITEWGFNIRKQSDIFDLNQDINSIKFNKMIIRE